MRTRLYFDRSPGLVQQLREVYAAPRIVPTRWTNVKGWIALPVVGGLLLILLVGCWLSLTIGGPWQEDA